MDRLIREGGSVDYVRNDGWSILHAMAYSNRDMRIIPTNCKIDVD